LLILFLLSPSLSHAQSQKIDVVDFMRAKFDYNGFTQNNSFFEINIHVFDKALNKWTHHTGLSTCPPEYGSCLSTNWESRMQTRPKIGDNIFYLYKGAKHEYLRPPYGGNEVFWYDDNEIYDFGEPYGYTPPGETPTTPKFGSIHNFYLPPEFNPNLFYPNRGYVWSKRYITIGQDNSMPFLGLKVSDWEEMKWKRDWTITAGGGLLSLVYYANWDSSKDTWNSLPDTGNLPTPLEVVVNEQINKDAQGVPTFMEKYFYAKNGNNSFGIIRYEDWVRREDVCGSPTCCTTKTCEGNLTLIQTNTFNILTHYDTDEEPDKYFNPSFYSDPKIEKYPGKPSNGTLPRGQFKLLGNGVTTDGTLLHSGDWMQLTSILTDTDYMLSEPIPDRHCPVGYNYLGAVATNFINHQQKDKGFEWAEFCGINKNVLLAITCPTDYESRGWFIMPDAFDYLGNNVGNQKLNYCVHYNEFHYPKKTISKPGDFNGDTFINLLDFGFWKTKYLQGQMTMLDFGVWKQQYLLN